MNKMKNYEGNVLLNPKYKNKQNDDKEQPVSVFETSLEETTHNDRMNRFHGKQGHGFAAEQANDLIDTLHGRDAEIKGDNNEENGADRMVDGQLIQTKYCKTAQASVEAAFRDGEYRYIDKTNNKLMQLEVPKDQYDEAVKIMRKKIAERKIKKYGITDPNDAEKLVRKGNIDYETACNIAKAGNIDSLMFDAAHGVVIATSAFGISAVITFAKAMWDGEPKDKAIDLAMYNGIKMGEVAFTSSVLAAQLTRTGFNNALMTPTKALVDLLPSKWQQVIANAMRDGAPIYGAAATKNLGKLVRGNIIADIAIVIVMSLGDIQECFNGRISGKQLFKNITILAAGVGGGTVGGMGGAALGGLILTPIIGPAGPVVGLWIGGFVGGSAGGYVGSEVMNKFIEDDAVEMVRIINKRFVPLVQHYLLNKEELNIVLDELKIALEKEKLLQMFVSKDRNKFADDMLTEIIEKVVCWRCRIVIPSAEEFIKGIGRVLALSDDKAALQAHLAKTEVDTVEMGKKLLGREVSKHAANKAFYVTKQMNMTLAQNEISMQNMKESEEVYFEKKKRAEAEIATYKKELDDLLVDF